MKNERETNGQTQLIYETDGMCTGFEATVIGGGKTDDGYYAMLDRTAFFPGGGGQQCDTGVFELPSGDKIEVRGAAIVDGEVRHFTDAPLSEGTKIIGRVNEKIRFARMQNHGSEHLISGLIRSLFGFENVGFHMTENEVVIDTGGPLTDEQLRIVEERANIAVFENVPFIISFPTSEEARDIDYRSKIEGLDNIRLVTVEGYDICACCAPHVKSTGQLGVIKIISATPHRGGMRLIVSAGMNAYHDYVMLHDDNAKIMEALSAKRDHTADAVADAMERMQSLREENTELKKAMTSMLTVSILEKIGKKDPSDVRPEIIFTEALDPVGLRNLVNEVTKEYKGIVCAFCGNDDNGYRYIFGVNEKNAESAGLKAFANDFNGSCNGKGGGSSLMVQGTSTATRKMIEEHLS